jgi:hypothetical protein
MQIANPIKAYFKSAVGADGALAEVPMHDGPHADPHKTGDDTRFTLQVAFSHVFQREVKVVFASDIPTGNEPGLVFIP